MSSQSCELHVVVQLGKVQFSIGAFIQIYEVNLHTIQIKDLKAITMF